MFNETPVVGAHWGLLQMTGTRMWCALKWGLGWALQVAGNTVKPLPSFPFRAGYISHFRSYPSLAAVSYVIDGSPFLPLGIPAIQ